MRVLRHCLDFQEGKPLACIGLGADITDGLGQRGGVLSGLFCRWFGGVCDACRSWRFLWCSFEFFGRLGSWAV